MSKVVDIAMWADEGWAVSQISLPPEKPLSNEPPNNLDEFPEPLRARGVEAIGPSPTTMTNYIRNTATFCLAIIAGLLFSNPAAALPPAAPEGLVALTAWMGLDGAYSNDIIVEVNVNGTKDWSRPDLEGRVDLLLPSGAVALIHFRKPGHLTKTVSVDTHNLPESATRSKQPAISFGVKLEPAGDKGGLAYAGPVGSITFDEVSGNMVIAQDQRLVPVRQQTVVF